VKLAAVVLLHDEDVFAERVIRNVAAVCDRVHVADHASTDRTWEVVSALEHELDNVEGTRIVHAARSHDLVLPYVGTDTWVLSADGDELFDPHGLRAMRDELEAGRYEPYFRLVPAMLHCVELDETARSATGYLAPPARSGPKLFNFSVLRSWDGVYRERLHEGNPVFLDGWSWESVLNLGEQTPWEETSFRCLHACFLRRSSRESVEGEHVRLNIAESNSYRRDLVGRVRRALAGRSRSDTSWKVEKYRQGPLATKDASPFL
jgi:hypothetical protein